MSRLILSIILCEGAGLIGAITTFPSILTWYVFLNKPIFTPPNWVFGPVWIVLYLLMGVSLYLVWKEKDAIKSNERNAGLWYFWAQLVLNVLWSVVFFGGHSLIGGLIIIVFLWVAIFLTIINFLKVNKIAGYLLIPYFAWVSLATILNISLVILNR